MLNKIIIGLTTLFLLYSTDAQASQFLIGDKYGYVKFRIINYSPVYIGFINKLNSHVKKRIPSNKEIESRSIWESEGMPLIHEVIHPYLDGNICFYTENSKPIAVANFNSHGQPTYYQVNFYPDPRGENILETEGTLLNAHFGIKAIDKYYSKKDWKLDKANKAFVCNGIAAEIVINEAHTEYIEGAKRNCKLIEIKFYEHCVTDKPCLSKSKYEKAPIHKNSPRKLEKRIAIKNRFNHRPILSKSIL